jgi:hypothetical protein
MARTVFIIMDALPSIILNERPCMCTHRGPHGGRAVLLFSTTNG